MKNQFHLFLILFSINITHAQEGTFRYINNDLEFQIGSAAFEDENGNFIIAASSDFTTALYKLNSQGELINSAVLDFAGYETQIFSIDQKESGDYRLIGTTTTFPDRDSLFMNLITVSEDLEILSDTPFYMETSGRVFSFTCESSGADTLLCAGIAEDFSPFERKPFVFRITDDVNFDSELYVSGEFFTGIASVPEEDYYWVDGFSFYQLNIDFSVIQTQAPSPFNLSPEGGFMRLNDSLIVITGRKYQPGGIRDIGIGTINNAGEEVNFNILGQPGEIIDHTARFKALDIKYQNKIYCGGHTDVVINLDPYLEVNTRFFIAQLDNEMNINWENYYGGDAFYVMYGVLATEDGGCMIYGRRHDFVNNPGVIELYVLKADENGDIVSSFSAPIQQKDFAVFPNPFDNQIHLVSEFSSEIATLKIYNLKGEILLSLDNFSSILNTTSLPAGLFILAGTDKNGDVLFKKKIVKR